jgi:amino acid permease
MTVTLHNDTPGDFCGQIAITVLGLVQFGRGRSSTSLTKPLFQESSNSPSAYALALYSGLWAFDGWDQANYVGGEMKNPEKNIPRAIHYSMIIVTVRKASSVSIWYLVTTDLDSIFTGECVLLCGSGQGDY